MMPLSPTAAQPVQPLQPSQTENHEPHNATNGATSNMVAATLNGSDKNAVAVDATHTQDSVQDPLRESKEKAKAIMAVSGVGTEERKEQGTSSIHSSRSATPDVDSVPVQSRKRSRSGSRLPRQLPKPDGPDPTRPPLKELYLEQYVQRDLVNTAAIADNGHQRRALVHAKNEEVQYWRNLRTEMRQKPEVKNYVYGPGYRGYGNGTQDVPGRTRLVYPEERKPIGGRRARPVRVTKKDAEKQSEQFEELVPVRLDIELDKIKLRDTFTWNLHDRVVKPEAFAETLVDDFKLPPETHNYLKGQVQREIQEQIQDFYPHVFIEEEPLDPHLPYSAYKNNEMRILIKLDITIGNVALIDQFEWDINNPLNSPEEFAKQLAREMSLSGEFVTAISHSIREQCQLFSRSLYITGHPFDGRPVEDGDVRENFLASPLPYVFRPVQMAKDYAPYLYELDEAALERTELSMLREQRRQKRSVNRRGGPALPDLKDRQRTVRTLVVSSVVPGAAQSVEESRLYRIPRATSGRGRRSGVGRAGDGEESEESESEESVVGSPAPSALQLPGTARTRGVRGAATAAQAAMRANFGRSATPEFSELHHGLRASSRRHGGSHDLREESVLDQTSLVVKLRIAPHKLRKWTQDIARRQRRGISEVTSTPTRDTPQRGTPQIGTPAAASMPPPPPVPPPPSSTLSDAPTDGKSSRQASETRDVGSQPQWIYQHDGRVDAPYPQPQQGPPPPTWLANAIETLRQRYPQDDFEAAMRYSAVDRTTNQPTRWEPNPPGSLPPPSIKHQYLPRIRCNDCPGKLYTALPDSTVENFEIHLKNRGHKGMVEARLKKGGTPIQR